MRILLALSLAIPIYVMVEGWAVLVVGLLQFLASWNFKIDWMG